MAAPRDGAVGPRPAAGGAGAAPAGGPGGGGPAGGGAHPRAPARGGGPRGRAAPRRRRAGRAGRGERRGGGGRRERLGRGRHTGGTVQRAAERRSRICGLIEAAAGEGDIGPFEGACAYVSTARRYLCYRVMLRASAGRPRLPATSLP